MENLAEYKEEIHSCSKCGICQSVCPIFKKTKNDCTVSRGLFIMLKGLIKGELKLSKKIEKYLNLCLECGACAKCCPSDVDVVKIIVLAKSEFFKRNILAKLISLVQKKMIFGCILNFINIFSPKHRSKKFDKKVIYFGGCGNKIKGNEAVIKILNACNVEVITPNFECCGIPFWSKGDLDSYKELKSNFIKKIQQYGINEVVTTCASCEKTLKEYNIEGISVKNIFEYMKEKELKLHLKAKKKVTFHKPCNIDNFEDVEWILNNTANLEYVEMKNYDQCCGLNGITNLREYKILSKIYKEKHSNIIESKTKIVLTSCLGCEAALTLFSFGKYKVYDIIDFLGKNI